MLRKESYHFKKTEVVNIEELYQAIMLNDKLEDAKVVVATAVQAKEAMELIGKSGSLVEEIGNLALVLDLMESEYPDWAKQLPETRKVDTVLEFQRIGMKRVMIIWLREAGECIWIPPKMEKITYEFKELACGVLRVRIHRK